MQSGDERRSARRRTFLGGKIVSCDAETAIHCTIRNRSETGARLEVAVPQIVPQRFYLLVPKERLAYEASYVWRTGSQLGVRLLHAVDLASLDAAMAGSLRALFEK
jgi:hypothetical protein